ncbi:MAG: InlB B-repeat-containing protein, partial [Clostridia bacterium]|nr:InlB B-repeat-containing protein [Clostridia bacterium]
MANFLPSVFLVLLIMFVFIFLFINMPKQVQATITSGSGNVGVRNADIVLVTLNGNQFKKAYSYAALCCYAVIYGNNGETYTGPILVSIYQQGAAFKKGSTVYSSAGSFSYGGYTWYYSPASGWEKGSYTDSNSNLNPPKYVSNSILTNAVVEIAKKMVEDHMTISGAVNGGHSGGTATCTEGFTCTKCEIPVPALGHNYQTATTSTNNGVRTDATCTAAATYYQKCSRCTTKDTSKYNSVGSALGHDFTSQTTTSTYLKSAATCTAKAVYYYKCSRCTEKGTTTYESGSALGHNYQTATTSTNNGVRTNATCTAAATYYQKCSRCTTKDTSKYNSVGSALGHDFTSQTTTSTYLKSAATCTAKAVYYYKCSRCTEKGTTTYESGSALGHDYQTATTSTNNGVRTDATCTAAATYYQKCSRCTTKDTSKYNSVGSALGHDFTSQTTTSTYLKSAATCTAKAVYYYKCSRCTEKGTTTYESGNALGHDFTSQTVTVTYFRTSATVLEAATYWYKCTRCTEKSSTDYYYYGSPIEANYEMDSMIYETLQEAIEMVPSGGVGTIKVLKDVVDASTAEVPENKTITLDTNGNTITKMTSGIINNGVLNITGLGTIKTSTNNTFMNLIETWNTLNVTDVTLEHQGSTMSYWRVIEGNGGTVTLNNANLKIENNVGSSNFGRGIMVKENLILNINGGIISENTGAGGLGLSIEYSGGGDITVVGATITSDYIAIYNATNNANIVIGTPYDGEISTTSPVIQGETYGISGSFEFYDGVIIGKPNALTQEPNVIETDYQLKYGTSGDDYQTVTLILPTYTATFRGNGGTTPNPEIFTRFYGEKLVDTIDDYPTTIRDGYEFEGWYTAEIGGVKLSEVSVMPNMNVTYYAHWTSNYSVEGEYYPTLEEAYNAVSGVVGSKNGTIVAERDNEDSSLFTVAVGDTIILDTNQKIITKTKYEILNYGDLEIKGGGKITTYDECANGHDFTSQTTTSTYLKSAATCTDKAVYYYKCSRCTVKGTNTYESGSALG